ELAGPHTVRGGVVAAHPDIHGFGVVGHLDDRPLCGGGPLAWFALVEVVGRVCRRPERLVEPAVGRHRRAGRGGPDGYPARGAVHDARELAQRGVVGTVFLHQRFERAAVSVVLVRISGAWSVETDGAGPALNLRHFTRFDEGEGGARIDETPDQPGGRRAIHA